MRDLHVLKEMLGLKTCLSMGSRDLAELHSLPISKCLFTLLNAPLLAPAVCMKDCAALLDLPYSDTRLSYTLYSS